jgi:hypothetical protein
MTGLWTPNGEVSPENNAETESQAVDQNPSADDVFAGMSDEEKQAAMEQISQMRAELLATPARDVIGNHIVGFYELASVHLSEAAQGEGADREARLREASLCIDAMAAVVQGLGDRLDTHAEPLQAALAQMQMAFTQVKNGDV